LPFTFQRTSIPDLVLIQFRSFPDERGFFRETYKRSDFIKNGISLLFIQTNHSRSRKRVLRGLHFQRPPKAQGKLVYVTRGEIFDVAVDLRIGSPTFGKWVGEILSEENHKALYIPPGFAHGFCVLSDLADVVYQVTEEYTPECEGGIRYDDPSLGISWPVSDPIVSSTDLKFPLLKNFNSPFLYEDR